MKRRIVFALIAAALAFGAVSTPTYASGSSRGGLSFVGGG
jgi:hypothetical protein